MAAQTKYHEVRLGNRTIGHLVQVQDHTNFVWLDDYWRDPNRPILGLHFEDSRRDRYAAALRLPPWFSNLLPEGRLREWIAADRNVSPQREMELLAQVGHDLPGAITVSPATEAPRVSAPSLQLDAHPAGDAEAGEYARIKFSLSGVQLKFSMLQKGDRLTLPASGRGDWIVKLPDATYPGVPRNEFVMMTLARDCGIDVPEIALHPRDELPPLPDVAWPNSEEVAFAIRRFDRDVDRKAVHIEDFAQVRNIYPDGKYQGSFATVAALCYRGSDVESLRQWCRRIVFNVLIGNGDAHLKNWSLLYEDPRRPRLSPAYDLVSTFWYSSLSGRDEDLGLTWGGKKLFERVTLKSLDALDSRLGAQAGLCDVARDTSGRFASAWAEHRGKLSGMTQLQSELDVWFDVRRRQFM